ncbi:GNAT family N-acetyltransferase [Mucilaginibacter segetis]|uniref:GNAT family N-acetyltransferase n=1 Tax=Mucilaginibacter segetis TaxID=2793071 RepID=A0A934UNV0_9SPHI|nr:GNAT family N-acetyltransferase [Mucilaginibacter segetis]MBK0380784.1 GNAT family N-acetyltransferase [Mucilaginibacter segetis]
MLSIEQIRPELTWRLRREVLYPDEPLFKMEMEEDNNGYHFGAFNQDKLVAVISLFKNDADWQFRKFAVSKDMQFTGVGTKLLNHITRFVEREGGRHLWCNARLTATAFYKKFGFSETGEVFSRNGHDYVIMQKPILSN